MKLWRRGPRQREALYYRPRHRDDWGWGWLLRSSLAALLFIVVYAAHLSGTALAEVTDKAVQYVLTAETDFSFFGQILDHVPSLQQTVFKNINSKITRPADPRRYLVRPLDGPVLSPFGWRVHPVLKREEMHEGVDIGAPLGTPVRAAAAGKVHTVSDSASLGKTVIIEHSSELSTVYGHLGDVLVSPGDFVSSGQVIARVGKTGITATAHLHFEVRDKGQPVNPLERLPQDSVPPEGK